MIGTIRVRRGRSQIVIKGPEAAEIESELRRVYAPMIDAAKSRADKVHAAMLRTWPIFTGRTRKSFEPFIYLDPARFRLDVGYRTDDPNVRYVRSAKIGRKRGATDERWALQTDLMAPMKQQQKPFANEAREMLQAALRRAFNG